MFFSVVVIFSLFCQCNQYNLQHQPQQSSGTSCCSEAVSWCKNNTDGGSNCTESWLPGCGTNNSTVTKSCSKTVCHEEPVACGTEGEEGAADTLMGVGDAVSDDALMGVGDAVSLDKGESAVVAGEQLGPCDYCQRVMEGFSCSHIQNATLLINAIFSSITSNPGICACARVRSGEGVGVEGLQIDNSIQTIFCHQGSYEQ